MDLKAKVEQRLVTMKVEFDKITQELADLVQKRAAFLSPLDQRMAELRTEQVRYQGRFKEINDLLNGNDELKMPDKTIPSKKK